LFVGRNSTKHYLFLSQNISRVLIFVLDHSEYLEKKFFFFKKINTHKKNYILDAEKSKSLLIFAFDLRTIEIFRIRSTGGNEKGGE